MAELPESIRGRFITAGWYPGRVVDLGASVPADHPARDVLAEFGGIVIMEQEPEDGWPAIVELAFEALPESSVSRTWARLLRSRLVGIARVHSDHAELLMDESGRCFGRSLIHDAFWFRGENFGQAVENILLNVRARPMLRPGQESISMYGEWYDASSPELYRY